jgi:hypothetical protein
MPMPASQLPITGSAHNATIVRDAAVAAVLATFDMATKRGCAATLDHRHHLELGQADMARMCRAPCWSMHSKDVGDLERRSQRD